MADKVENKRVGIETLKSFTSPEELEVWELLVKVHDKLVKLPDKHHVLCQNGHFISTVSNQ